MRSIEMGDMRIEVRYLGPAHSPGDIVVWRRLALVGAELAKS